MEFRTQKKFTFLLSLFNILVLIGSVLIFIILSVEFLEDYKPYQEPFFLSVQLWVCIIFMADFVLRWIASKRRARFFLYNFVFFIVSIPFLNIAHYMDLQLDHTLYYLVRLIPVIRGAYGLIVIIKWVNASVITSIFFSYLIIIVGFTFFASTIFYSTEKGINPGVKNYWDALYWALMNVTTVGASIFAKGLIGQVLAVMLAGSGMMLFPIFTAYITMKVQKEIKGTDSAKERS